MKKSKRFMAFIDINEDIDPEEVLKADIKHINELTGLSENKLRELIFEDNIDCITPTNFEAVLEMLDMFMFNNLNQIIIKLNTRRDLTFPEIENNVELREILNETCICTKDKCTSVKMVTERGHIKCYRFLGTLSRYAQYKEELSQFPFIGIKHNLKFVNYLLDNDLFEKNGLFLYRKIERLFKTDDFELGELLLKREWIAKTPRNKTIFSIEAGKTGFKWINLIEKYGYLDRQSAFDSAIGNGKFELAREMHEKKFATECSVDVFKKLVRADNYVFLKFLLENGYKCKGDAVSMCQDIVPFIDQKVKDLFYEYLEPEYFDNGHHVNTSLPPVRIVVDERVVETLNEISGDPVQYIDNIPNPNYENQTRSINNIWIKNTIGDRPLDSPAYAKRFGTQCSTKEELARYLKNPSGNLREPVHIKIRDRWELVEKEYVISYAKNHKEDEIAVAVDHGRRVIKGYWKTIIKTLEKDEEIESEVIKAEFEPITITAGTTGSRLRKKPKTMRVTTLKDALEFLNSANTNTKVIMQFDDEDDEYEFENSKHAIKWLRDNF